MKTNELLRKYRIEKELTLADIALRSKKPLSRISAIERGAIRLTVEEFIELCIKAYDLSPDEIISESVDKKSVFRTK